jgi:hypothetical protein
VPNSVALVAEPDRALRDLMRRTLSAAGYEVFESSNIMQLEAGLRVRAVYRARNLLYVLASEVAAECAAAISAASRERARLSLAEVQLILTCEFGRLTSVSNIPHCSLRGVLEKTFDLYELQAMAFECRDFLCESETNGAPA